jgi:hypothetical protein
VFISRICRVVVAYGVAWFVWKMEIHIELSISNLLYVLNFLAIHHANLGLLVEPLL